MYLTVCGVNHKTAPLVIRERLSVVPERMPEPLHHLVSNTSAQEAVILSTCNRTELYCIEGEQKALLTWLAERNYLSANELASHMYYHEGEAAVQHMLRVASGLDSMVIGEPQILGQMKSAFQMAVAAGTTGAWLQRLFQYIFSATKSIRSQTGIGNQAVSIAFAAVNLAKHIFSDLTATSVLTIGTGSTIELCLRYLQNLRVKNLYIANRTFSKAENLAQTYNGSAIEFAKLPEHLAKADIVISAVSAPLPVVGKGMIERALKTRKHKPMLLIDLGVPRNIEPEITSIKDAYLYCIDDLSQIIAENLRDRKAAAEQAEEMILLQTEHFMQWLNSLDAINIVRAFRDKVTKIRDQEINKTLRLLHQGHPPEEVLYQLANSLTNKIMHQPTVNIKMAGFNKQTELLACAKILFEIE